MATSTTTLLQAANRILFNVNERPVSDLTSLLGQQVQNVIRSALTQISQTGDWTWLRDRVNATTWSADLASLEDNIQRIESVAWYNGDRFIEIPFNERNIYDLRNLEAYDDDGHRPYSWTYGDGINSVRLSPYPTTAAEREKIWFYVVKTLPLPASDSGVFTMPEIFVELLILKGSADMCLIHLEDPNMYAAFSNEYNIMLSRMMGRMSSQPTHSFNMYKGARRYGK